MFPEERDWQKFTNNYTQIGWTLENTWLPFSRSYVINVTKTPVDIYLAVKPDMRDNDPRVILDNDYDERYTLTMTGTNSGAYWAITTIECTRTSDVALDSRLVTISV